MNNGCALCKLIKMDKLYIAYADLTTLVACFKYLPIQARRYGSCRCGHGYILHFAYKLYWPYSKISSEHAPNARNQFSNTDFNALGA
jgi:hypothetical protein